MRRLLLLIQVCVAAVTFSGCEHKEVLCPDSAEREIEVRFHWDNAPEASPAGMTLYFYPRQASGKIWRFDIAGRDGGPVSLPVGRYSMLAFNNDLQAVVLSDDRSFSGATASMKLNDGTGRGTGRFYSGCVSDLEVTPCGVTYVMSDGKVKECGHGLVRCYPLPRYCNYTVIVEDVKGGELVRSASALLGGVSPDVKVASGLMCGGCVRLQIGLDVEDVRMCGTSTAFGMADDLSGHPLTLRVTRTDGKTLLKNFDVTGQVDNAPNPREVVIVINGLEIPADSIPLPPDGGDGDVGITVGVDGWTVVNVDLTT